MSKDFNEFGEFARAFAKLGQILVNFFVRLARQFKRTGEDCNPKEEKE